MKLESPGRTSFQVIEPDDMVAKRSGTLVRDSAAFFRCCRSALIWVALWYRLARCFSIALSMICSSAIGR